MATKYIQRKSTVTLPKTTGNIVDTLNVEDKITNAPSINLVQMMAGVPEEGVIEFDGDEIPEGYEEVEGKSFITTGLSANYTATATNQIILPMKNVFSKYGNAFTVQSDGTILMNKDMYIKIHAQIFFSAATAGSKSLILRLNNDTEISYSVNENVAQYSIIPTHTGIISVKKGDVVKLTAYLFANESISAMQKNTFMTIEEMDEPRNIQRKSAVKVSRLEGNIVDTTNIKDKKKNTYSANVIEGLMKDFITLDDIPQSSNNRRASVGQTAGTNGNPYYLVAELTSSAAYADYQISFHVWSGYADDTKNLGILTAHFRLSGSGVVEQYQLRWEYANTGINLSDFKLAFNAGSSPANVQLWAVCNEAWQGYHFDVISEGVRTGSTAEWTLYNTWSEGSHSGITPGYTVADSTLNAIYNPMYYGNFVVTQHALYAYGISAYNSNYYYADAYLDGYYPLAIVSRDSFWHNNAGFTVNPIRIENRSPGYAQIYFWAKNDANGATSDVTAYCDVLWVKV